MSRFSSRPSGIAMGFAVVLAGLLAWCALPVAIADLIVLPHEDALYAAGAGLPVAVSDRAAAADASLRAARWAERDRHLTDAAVVLLAPPAPVADAEAARAVLGEALAARPTSRRNWLRLASARLTADRAGARAAWTMAAATAPFDPTSLGATLTIGFALLPTQDAGFVARLARRVRFAALLDPLGLARAARAAGAEAFVYASLFGDPDLGWRFALALAAVSRPPVPSVGTPP